ncbi:MAG: GNAT family N-acetyltransferase [Caldilineaceae bacterium]|nr:GNAT family N-acetyltransferase [Caldilineaceae bacterium]
MQEVYQATPGYWAMYELTGAPAGQARRDLEAAAATPGRSILGIVRRLVRDEPQAGMEMVGVVDLRLQWPDEQIAYVSMIMVAETHQRQGIGSRAWQLLRPWLVNQTSIQTARVGVEQFNPGALLFFQQLGFALTGDADRVAVGDKFVRLLYLDRALGER